MTAVRKTGRKLFLFLFQGRKNSVLVSDISEDFFLNIKLNSIFSLPSEEKLIHYQNEILSYADRTSNLEFNVFGSGWKRFETGKIDWQSDFISDFRWNGSSESGRIQYGNVLGADIKVPWELGRMQFLPCLALANHLLKESGIKNYSQTFQSIVTNFIDNNKPGYGTQWISSMDVAIRISNILLSYDLFVQQGVSFGVDFENKLKRSIIEHGEYIFKHPEWNDGLRGNHYLACLSGLILVAAYLPESNRTIKWKEFACRELIKEIDYQFNKDGSNFEDSSAYHFLSSEIVITALILMERHYSFKADERLYQKIRRMAEFSFALMKQNNTIDLIGDNDSGRFFRIWHPEYPVSNDFLDVLSLFEVYGIEFPAKFDTLDSELFPAGENLSKDKTKQIEDKNYFAFPDFGLYIYKNENYFLTVKCGKAGQKGKGGHSHNDRLAITLNSGSKDFFVDSGSQCYTSDHDKRNLFRSVMMHNTLIAGNEEQNKWMTGTKDDLFWLINEKAKTKCTYADQMSFSGVHYAYGAAHIRTIKIKDDSIEARDICRSNKGKRLLFNLHPNVRVKDVRDNSILLQNGDKHIQLSWLAGKLRICDSLYSKSYCFAEKSERIELDFDGSSIEWKIDVIE